MAPATPTKEYLVKKNAKGKTRRDYQNISGLRKLSINFNQDEKVDYISVLFIGKKKWESDASGKL